MLGNQRFIKLYAKTMFILDAELDAELHFLMPGVTTTNQARL